MEKVGSNKDVLQDEIDAKGKVEWNDYKKFFRFSLGGLWGIALVFVLHIVINLCTVAVSIYLGLTLTNHFTAPEQ